MTVLTRNRVIEMPAGSICASRLLSDTSPPPPALVAEALMMSESMKKGGDTNNPLLVVYLESEVTVRELHRWLS